MRVLNASQMQEADRRTVDELGVRSGLLMENAGARVVEAIDAHLAARLTGAVAVLCGRGNNGGDAFVVARLLVRRGVPVAVALVGRAEQVTGDARANLEAVKALGVPIAEVVDAEAWAAWRPHAQCATMVVDGLFGTGLRGPLTGLVAEVIGDVNGWDVPIVAIDLPSGVSADSAEVAGPAIRATLTVALGTLKLPLVLPPAEALAGRVVVADIGIRPDVIESVDGPRVEVLTRVDARGLLPVRRTDTHKGHYGRVLIVAGSKGKTGAAVLAAMAALRTGAGLVTLATPASVLPIVSAMGLEFMTLPLPDVDGVIASGALECVLDFDADVIACGPGLGTGESITALVAGLVASARVPLVLDADALNALAASPDAWHRRSDVEIAITPHQGEMARLVRASVDDVVPRRLDVARDYATEQRVHVVLKGHRTVIASPDGSVAVNLTGNPGMATAGSGDVLTGMIAGLFGSMRDMTRAARVGVYLHGLAGDLAATSGSETSLIAGDILSHIGAAVRDIQGPASRAWGSEL